MNTRLCHHDNSVLDAIKFKLLEQTGLVSQLGTSACPVTVMEEYMSSLL